LPFLGGGTCATSGQIGSSGTTAESDSGNCSADVQVGVIGEIGGSGGCGEADGASGGCNEDEKPEGSIA
jgi:hypothetical protein